ncbi:spindle pole body component 110-like [Triticum dicoccoides]|uniref:spindle pole body component 110-like n=1 Tax=Triticum dicoccoides TaxID=85692 RepID=UPI000E7BCB57|nr:spindle pole body component 110-like [Triticum dicoccoides]
MESSGLRKRVADMMDGGKYKPKGYGMAGAGQRLPCALLLLLVLAGTALSVVVMHKVREQRTFAVVLKERDVQAVSLRIQLQKEKAYGKETKRKAEEMKATMSSLRTQKTDLKTKLKTLEATATILKNAQKELEASLKERESRISQMEGKAANLHSTRKALEASLKERENRIKQMQDKVTSLEKTQKEQELSLKARDSRISQLEEKTAAASNPDQMAALMEILQRKEAELEEIKTRFQDYRTTDRKVVGSKSTPARTNPTTPAVVVAGKVTNSSRNSTIPARSEEKRAGNTTVTESKIQKPKTRSLEEKQVKLAVRGSTRVDELQEQDTDFLDMDDIYGDSHAKKSELARRNKKVLPDSHVENQKSGHPLDQQDSHHVRYNKLLEKENIKPDETKKKNSTVGPLEKISKDETKTKNSAVGHLEKISKDETKKKNSTVGHLEKISKDETKKKNSTVGHLEKISKDSLSDVNLDRPRQGVAAAADVKPKVPVNDDLQQNKKQKNKKPKSKKKVVDTSTW